MTEVQQHLLELWTRLIAFNGVIPPPPFCILAVSLPDQFAGQRAP